MSGPRILVTGSRNWPWERSGVLRTALIQALGELNDRTSSVVQRPTLVVGDCLTGVDVIAAWLWQHDDGVIVTAGADRVQRPEVGEAHWRAHGKAAGPLRNQAMVDAGADLCLAFPLGPSRGTRGCVRRAEAAGIPVRVHEQVRSA